MATSSLQATLSPHAENAEFPAVLRKRLDGYFKESGISKRATPLMWAKLFVGFGVCLATYASLYAFNDRLNAWQFLLVYVFLGQTQLFLLLNIAHDSNHYAITRNKFVGKLLTYVFDIFGINSYMWRILHNTGHHSNINIIGDDEDVIARGYLRYTPKTPWHPRHRYQHIYAWFLYGLSIFDHAMFKDFDYFFLQNYRRTKIKHAWTEYLALFASKIFFLGYMVALPIVVLKRPPLFIAACFMASFFVIGIVAQFIFQTTHIIETSYFPGPKSDFDSYTYHVLATTADYATESVLAKWFMGGLNHHVAHHLCPGVCHTHYPALTKIVKETAAEYRIPYRAHRTVWQAVVRHFALLKRLGMEA
jgi:linoleoyl-CoA desaturase